MKSIHQISLGITLIIAAAVTLSYTSGAGAGNLGNLTGSTGLTSPSCGGGSCHIDDSNNLPIFIRVFDALDPNQQTIGQYIPGKTYIIEADAYTTVGSYPNFGFQMAVVNRHHQDAGIMVIPNSLMSNLQKSFDGVTLLEQQGNIKAKAGNNYFIQVPWIAPASGTGDVKIHLAVCGSNANGFAKDDYTNRQSITLQEGRANNINELSNDVIALYPNPTKGKINLKATDAIESIAIFNSYGQVVYQQTAIQAKDWQFDFSHLAKGTYYIKTHFINYEVGLQTVIYN